MIQFLSGLIASFSVIIGIFFLRFGFASKDRLFFIFALAFFVMGAERVVLLLQGAENERDSLIYLLRLSANCLILCGIIDKNRKSKAKLKVK